MIRHASLTSILLAACAAHAPTTPGLDELAGENGQDGEAPKADDPYNNFGLYEVRKIGAFECNGAGSCTHLEFDRANRSTMICADGASHATCTARTLDTTNLPLSASKLDAVTNALQRQAEDPTLGTQVLVRGVFVHGTMPAVTTQDGDWVTFAPTEIWVAQKANGTTDGTFVRLTDNNVRCITSPCASIHEGRLNSSRGMDIDGIDFGDDDALQDAVYGALSTPDGVIVVGTRTYGEHGTSDKLRTTNQVYLRVN